MSWKDELKPASCNGIPFKVDNVSTEFGWDTKVREVQSESTGKGFPKKKKTDGELNPDIESGTKRPKTFSLDAHFSGDNYLFYRDAFVSAIEAGGILNLQLPLLPLLKVVASRATLTYSNTAGGFESFRVQFIETKETKYPLVTDNFKRLGEVLAESIKEELIDTIVESFSPEVDGAAELAESLAADMLDVTGIGDAGDTYSSFADKATDLSTNARTIIQTPQRFAEQIMDTVDDLRHAFRNPLDAFGAQLQIFDTFRGGLDTELNGSEARRLQVENNLAVAMAVENATVVTAGLSAMDATFDTLADALAYRKKFEEYVKLQQERNGELAGYESIYRDLSILLGRVTEYINDAAGLPSSTDIELNAEVPALVLVEDYYGDADRTGELVTRNTVKHPLFLSGAIEVLST